MGKGKLWILILSGLLLCVMLFVGGLEAENSATIRAEFTVEDQTEIIRCWQSDGSTAYLFLPDCVPLDQVRLRVTKDGIFCIGDTPVVDGMTCGGFRFDIPYVLTVSGPAGISADTLVFVQTGDVDTLFLDVSSGSMDYLNEDKRNGEPGQVRLYTADGHVNSAGTVETVSGRGQSTWSQDKKSYNMRLNTPADLFGMGSAENWVLQANSVDVTSIRNKMVFDFAAEAGIPYSPDSRWVNLYLNGEYWGLYLLCERIEVHPERVDIPQEGSFLVVKDREWRFSADGDPFIVTKDNTALGIRYADMSQAQLLQIWQTVENAILSEDGIDPVTGKTLRELIDLDSWVNKFLIEEVFANVDGNSLSQYFYLDGSTGDVRISAGPVWDYDLTLGDDPYQFYVNKQLYGSHWYPALYRNTDFYQRMRQQYGHVFRPLLQELIDYKIESYTQMISQAAAANACRWGLGDNREVIAQMHNYLTERIAFLDSIWMSDEPHVVIGIYGYEDTIVFTQEPGKLLPPLPENPEDPSIVCSGWFHLDTGEPVDITQPVMEDTDVYLKYEIAEQEVPVAVVETEPERIPVRRWAPIAIFLVMEVAVLFADSLRQRHTPGRHRSRTPAKRK